jgi:GTPase SAR1 family protein
MEISSGIIEGAQKIVIYGPEGIGKSSLAAKFPNPIFIDTEGSTKRLNVKRTPRPSSWTMLMEQVRYYKNNPHELDTLVIDTADWAEQLCKIYICAKYQKDGIEEFGYGKGYVYLMEEFGKLLNTLTDLMELGINIVVTAHAQMRKFEQPDEMGSYDRWELKLEKKIFPLVKEWADMVLFINYKTYVVNSDGNGKGTNKAQGGKRIMYTEHHPCWDAKNRHELKSELPLDYKEIAHCIPLRNKINIPKLTPRQEEPAQNLRDIPESKPIEKPKEELKPELSKEDIPKQLLDLMTANNVTVEEIQKAVAKRGYFPIDTPISNYPKEFIDGCLIARWSQVCSIIEEIRNNK